MRMSEKLESSKREKLPSQTGPALPILLFSQVDHK